jgi:hypothetical protein
VCKNRKATCAGGGGGFQFLNLAELPHPPRAPVRAVVIVVVIVVVVVVVVMQTTTLPGVGAEDAVRIGKLCFNSVLKYLLPTAVSTTQSRGYA